MEARSSADPIPRVLAMNPSLRFALILSSLVVVLLALRGLLSQDAVAPQGVEAAGPDAAELVPPPAANPARTLDAAPRASVREVVSSPEPATAVDAGSSATLIVQVRWDDDGSPGAGLGVSTFPISRPNPFLHRRRAVTDPDGRVTFQVRAPGRVGAYVDLGDSEFVELEPGEEHLLELSAQRWAEVRGRVVDHVGSPVADAGIWVSAGANYTNGSAVARTRLDGGFQVPIGMHNYIGARKAGHVPSHLRSPRAGKGAEVEMVLPLRGFSGRVVGTVRDADGEPVADALLHLGTLRGHNVELEDGRQGTQAPGLGARSDEEGHFEIDSAEPGTSRLYARGSGYAVTEQTVEIEAQSPSAVEVVLIRGLTARGTVRDGEGKPLEDVRVAYGDYAQFTSGHTKSAADGTYELTGGSPLEWVLVAKERGMGEDSATLTGEPGAVVEWDPVLDPGLSIHGRVVDSTGSPLDGLSLTAERDVWTGGGQRLQARSGADGAFRLTNAEDTPYRLVVRERGSFFPVYSQGGVRPSPEPLTIAIPDENRPSAHVRGRVVLPEGVNATLVAIREGENSGPFVAFDADSGEFEGGPWPPGSYRLWLVGEDYPYTTLATFELVRGERRDLGVLELEAPGKLVLTVVGADGAPVPEASAMVLDRSGDQLHWGEPKGEQGLTLDLAPGSYLVRVSADEAGAAHTRIDVRPGETIRVQLTLDTSTALGLELSFPEDETREMVFLTIRVVDETGWTVELQHVGVRPRGWTTDIPLPPGRYRVVARTGDGRTAEASGVVTAGGSSPPVLLEFL